jgi:hypothetical protein
MKTRRLTPRRLNLEQLETRLAPSATTSTNWSGYAVTAPSGTVTAVSGSWVVPTASGTGTAYSSAWVGIDGFNSNSVEQIGTDSDVVNGRATYYAWYEMYPNPSYEIALAVRPGDRITASVTYSSGTFALALTDASTGKGFTISQTAPGASRSSAEWIEEAPSSRSGILPLADFGTISFSGAQATINGTTGAIDNPAWSSSVEQINMVTSGGAAKDSTSKLTDSGSTSGFSVTWISSGTSGTSGGHGRGSRSTVQSADQATLITAASQAGQQAATAGITTPLIRPPLTLGAPASLLAVGTAGAPAVGSPATLFALFGTSGGTASVSLPGPVTSANGGGGQDDLPPAPRVADPAPQVPAPQVPAPQPAPNGDGDSAGDLAGRLSGAWLIAAGGAPAGPEHHAVLPPVTEGSLVTAEGRIDALFTLALGSLLGLRCREIGSPSPVPEWPGDRGAGKGKVRK